MKVSSIGIRLKAMGKWSGLMETLMKDNGS